MKYSYTTLTAAFSLSAALISSIYAEDANRIAVPTPASKPKIQIALLLDTSNSMDGLIDQAKSRLWSVINTFSNAKYKGKDPVLEVALYEYGKTSLPSDEGFTRMLSPFTTDLDTISERLFNLETNGGQEYCGYVIKQSLEELNWSENETHLKAIFIAGNEPFTQGEVHYKKACKASLKQGVTVSTIFCGNRQEGINTKWEDGALRGNGNYMNIDQNQTIQHIRSPYDDSITQLNSELNETYIPYGAQGRASKARQEMQDSNASSFSIGSLLSRAQSKSGKYYSNSHWDLCDAVTQEQVDLNDIDTEALPENMQSMTMVERENYVKTMIEKRRNIQTEIKALNQKREAFVIQERQKKSKSNSQNGLEDAMIESLRNQAERMHFTL